jgi:hypothetical protein
MPCRIPILLFAFLFFCGFTKSKKSYIHPKPSDTMAIYEGGHKWFIQLILDSKGTFSFLEITDFFFFKRSFCGQYKIIEGNIVLYRKKKIAFLRSKSKRTQRDTFVLTPFEVQLYHLDKNNAKDSAFYKAYYTLKRVK